MGYIGFSRSERSQEAIDRGLIVKTQMSAWQKRAVEAGAVLPCEWHHTGKYFSKTNYYDPNDFEDLNPKDFPVQKKEEAKWDGKWRVLVSAHWKGSPNNSHISGTDVAIRKTLTSRQKDARKYYTHGGHIKEFQTFDEALAYAKKVQPKFLLNPAVGKITPEEQAARDEAWETEKRKQEEKKEKENRRRKAVAAAGKWARENPSVEKELKDIFGSKDKKQGIAEMSILLKEASSGVQARHMWIYMEEEQERAKKRAMKQARKELAKLVKEEKERKHEAKREADFINEWVCKDNRRLARIVEICRGKRSLASAETELSMALEKELSWEGSSIQGATRCVWNFFSSKYHKELNRIARRTRRWLKSNKAAKNKAVSAVMAGIPAEQVFANLPDDGYSILNDTKSLWKPFLTEEEAFKAALSEFQRYLKAYLASQS